MNRFFCLVKYVVRSFFLTSQFSSSYELLGDEVVKHGGFWQVDFGSIAMITLPKTSKLDLDEIFTLFHFKPSELTEWGSLQLCKNALVVLDFSKNLFWLYNKVTMNKIFYSHVLTIRVILSKYTQLIRMITRVFIYENIYTYTHINDL